LRIRRRRDQTPESDRQLQAAARRFGYDFGDHELLRGALTHASVPRGDDPSTSERLEYLGDAALSLAVSELLFVRHPDWAEGKLSRARATCVRTESLAGKARALGLAADLRLGKGEDKSGGRSKASILAAVYEAVLGAVLLDGGYEKLKEVVAVHFAPELGAVVLGEDDFKTRLQERVQCLWGTTPQYRVVDTLGPDHARQYVVTVAVAGRVVGQGAGPSKRSAEQKAAFEALLEPGFTMRPRER
jgi:ribonuclease-3